MFCEIVFVCYLIYLIVVLRFIYRAFNKYFKYFETPQSDLEEKYKPFQRVMQAKKHQFEVYFCAIVLAPFRMLIVIGLFVFMFVFLKIILHNENQEALGYTELPRYKRKMIEIVGEVAHRTILFTFGFYYIEEKNVKITDLDPTYKGVRPKDFLHAPIRISNHVSHIDISYHCAKASPSFLSKASIGRAYVLGICTKALQSIFIDRDQKDSKIQTLELIQKRCDDVMKEKKNLPPLLIFPEGTTTNGKYLIKFKHGAFSPIAPIDIICLQYDFDKIPLSSEVMNILYTVFFQFFFFKNKLTVYRFDTFYPDYLNLDKNKLEDVTFYQDKIEALVAKCLNLQVINSGWLEKKLYHDKVEKIIKEQYFHKKNIQKQE